jgi:hypothetical protein
MLTLTTISRAVLDYCERTGYLLAGAVLALGLVAAGYYAGTVQQQSADHYLCPAHIGVWSTLDTK